MKLGIKPERIRRGKPTENGRHERMHRTLKADAIKQRPVASSQRGQQRVFDEFRMEFNEERPHEALEMRTPREVYDASPRRYDGELRSPTYDSDWSVGYVGRDGQLRIGDKRFFVSQVLRGEPVGIRHGENGSCEVFYGPLKLATITASGKLRRGGRTLRSVHERPSELHSPPSSSQSAPRGTKLRLLHRMRWRRRPCRTL